MTVSIRRFIWGVLQWFIILDRSSGLGFGGIKSPPRITAAMELFLLSASGYAVDTTSPYLGSFAPSICLILAKTYRATWSINRFHANPEIGNRFNATRKCHIDMNGNSTK